MKKYIKKLILEYQKFMDEILDDPDEQEFHDIINRPEFTPRTNNELVELVNSLLKKGYKNLNIISLSYITDFSNVFRKKNLEGVDISNWGQYISNGTHFTDMFLDAKNIPSCVSEWSLDNVINAKNMFKRCVDLKYPPKLPQANLNKICYAYMFEGCKSLVEAPELPATTLADSCYRNMFSDCISLTKAPELPATELAKECYNHMFKGCSSLTIAPQLPAVKLKKWCYFKMFCDCTSLIKASELPALIMKNDCYFCMFQGCTSLTEAPELPATKLANSCYGHMFAGCTSLTKAPSVLPALECPNFCYSAMFSGCTSLASGPDLPATSVCMDGFSYSYMYGNCPLSKPIKIKVKLGKRLRDEIFVECFY